MSDDLRLLAFLIPASLLVGLIFYSIISGIVRRRKAPTKSYSTGKTTFVPHWFVMSALLILVACLLFLVLSFLRSKFF